MNAANHRYVVCIQTRDVADLVLRKVHEVLEDPIAVAHGHLRVID
jgi:hypothetical protein